MFISLFPPISIPCSGLSDRFKASQLRVRHPGYSDDNNLLLIFCPSDGPPDAPGVQHSIVHTSCATVADNRFDGWLSRTRDPLADRVQSAPSDLLPVAEYYYHLPLQYPVISDTPNLSALYPIVPSFRQWKFPPLGFLPAPWREATIAPLSDNTIYSNCRLTSSVLVTETAHVIPAGEKEWFTANSMDTIGTNTVQGEAVIDTEGNTLRLRQDAHTLWDRMHYSIVPKLKLLSAEGGEQGRGEGEWVWTTHVTKGLSELHDTYHNRMLHPLKGVRREYLFARFAWDLFPMVQGFLQPPVSNAD
ncbi:hypothetical protein LTR54_017577 [Friedmanniomyces endolithicus]|nr:hypothetical protein LTR54_017577 [Friedmanniomyces endolithicus]